VSGATAAVRVKPSPSHGHVVTYTCTTCKTSRRIPAPPVLAKNPDVKVDGDSGLRSLDAQPVEDMDIDAQGNPKVQPGSSKKARKTIPARVPPFFDRNVGHVVFCGNDKVQDTTA